MSIRKVIPDDAEIITELNKQLGYELPVETVREKIERLSQDENDLLLVYVDDNRIVGFISIHYIPQIAVDGDFARINYFCVDENSRGKKIGDTLEKYCVEKALERGCDRVELHCHSRRTNSHRFYVRQGYVESPKYFVKHLKK